MKIYDAKTGRFLDDDERDQYIKSRKWDAGLLERQPPQAYGNGAGAAVSAPTAAPGQPRQWKVSMGGLMTNPTPVPGFVPLPTKPAAGFQGVPTTPRGAGSYARTGDANMDLRLRNAGVLPYLPARQGQPGPAELALQKREAYLEQKNQAEREMEAAKGMAGFHIDDFLSRQGALSNAEKIAARNLLKELDKQWKPVQRQYQGSPRDGMGAKPLPEEARIMLAKMDALRLKTKTSEAALYGGLDSITFGLSNRLEKGENEKRIGQYEAKLAAGQPLTKAEEADFLMLRSLGGGTSFQAAQNQSPLAYGAGKFAGESVKYALGNTALDMIPGAGKAFEKAGSWIAGKTGGKVSAELAKRLVEGRVQDLPFDLINAAVETDSPEEFAKNLGVNQAMGLGTDIGFEALAAGWRAIKEAAQNGRLKQYVDPGNIRDADIDAYMAKVRGGDAPKTEVVKGSDLSRQISQETYWNQINRVMRGENPPDIIKIGQTPEILKQYGAKDRTLTMNPAAVRKIAYPNGYMGGQHNLGFYALEHLPEQLENPVAILKSATQDDSLVVFTEFLDQENRPVMAALHLDKSGRVGVTNNVASYYGRKGFDSFLSEQRNAGNVLYEDKKRILEQLPGVGLQLPKMEADADPIFNIPRNGSKINGQNGGNPGSHFDPLTAPLDAANQARAKAEETMKAFLPQKETGFVDDFGQNISGAEGYGPNTVGAAQSAFPTKQKTSRLYDNTFQKTPLFTQAEKALANAAGMDREFKYDVISEKKSLAEAAERMALDAAGEMADLPAKGSWSGADLDTAMLILEQKRDQWRKNGNHDGLVQWAKLVREKGTEAGQMIQAFAKYSRTPEGTIIKAEGAIADYAKKLRDANPKLFKAIDAFAEELERVSLDFRYDMPADPDAATAKLKNAVEEFAKKHAKVNLDDETTDEIIRAIREGRGNKDAIGDILQAAEGIPQLSAEDVGNVLDIMAKAEDFPIYSRERYRLENQAWKIVADHFDSSFMDKWNAWRYMAMLGNTRTHIRNMVGNTMFGAATRIKNGLAAAVEGTADKAIRAFGGEGIDRTKSILAPLDRELNRAAKNDFNDMYALIAGNGKYNPSDMIRDNMTVFQTKWLEKLRKLNTGALEAEDAFALKDRYSASMAGWLKANGYGAGIFKDTSETAQDALNRARAYAIQEAQKATFRDDSRLATALSNMSRSSKAANVIIEGIVPFKKTPINIVKRGIEYSPAGLAKGVMDAVDAIKTGRKTAAEAIDEIAAGLTGTGIMYLGYKLAEGGLISGSGSGDSRERGFDAMTGNQNYALVIDGKSYTLDWAAPAALPLFVGAELFQTKGAQISGAGLLDSITKITEPVLDMTMMQGLNDAIQSAAYEQAGPLASIGINAVSNYATQGVPTLSGQVARAADDTRRSTYYGGGAFLDRFLPENFKKAASEIPGVQGIIDATLPKPVDIAAQKAMAKIPWLSMLLNPKVDQWGREQKNQGGSFGGRLAYNMLSPGFYAERNMTDVDREIERLYGESGEKGVLPGYASKTIAQKDAEGNRETKRLSAGEFVRFAKDRGGAAYKSLDTLFRSEAYRAAGDADKADMVADIYEYTNAAAKTGVSGYKPSGWVEKAMEAEKDGIALEDYVLCRNVLTPLKRNVEKNEKLLEMDATAEKKETLYRYFVSDSESSRKKIDAFKAAGLDMDDYLTAQIEYAHIDEGAGSAREKATAFYQWLDGQGLSGREYQAVAQAMPFFQMFPAKPEAYRVGLASDKVQAAYTSLHSKYGMSEKQFMNGLEAVQDVEGVKGKNGKTISGSQKKARYQAAVKAGMNPSGARVFLMEVYGYKDGDWT